MLPAYFEAPIEDFVKADEGLGRATTRNHRDGGQSDIAGIVISTLLKLLSLSCETLLARVLRRKYVDESVSITGLPSLIGHVLHDVFQKG